MHERAQSVDRDTLFGPFRFVGTRVEGRRVELDYGIGDDWTFTEMVELPAELPRSAAVDHAVQVLHLVAGVSYYKCVAPEPLVVPELSDDLARLVRALYDEGLREFAYRNGLPVPLPVELVTATGADHRRIGALEGRDARERSGGDRTGVLPDGGHGAPGRSQEGASLAGALVPIGGGKDSALVASLVPDGQLFAVNPVGAHQHLAEALGRELVSARRTLDPQLKALVAAGVPNGHVPVTAITSAISVLAALALGRRDVLMGIERSADEPSVVTADGVAVNHQFSKSTAAEQLLRDVFAPAGVRYLSLLRPLTELAIGAAVARRGLAADIVSCNRVFTVWNANTSSREGRPCGDCAKCLFTALMLAPCSTPAQIEQQYGRALLDEVAHVDGVRALWSEEKPFDCVGERLETAASLVLLDETPAWRDQVVVRSLAGEARELLAKAGVEPSSFLTLERLDDLPADYRTVVGGLASDLADVPGLAHASR